MVSLIYTAGLTAILSISAAFLLDILFGDPYWFPHPVRFIGKYINCFEKLVRKLTNSSEGLRICGVLLTASTVIFTYITACLILVTAAKLNLWIYHFVNVVLLYTCLATKCLAHEAIKIFLALQQGDIENARKLLSYIVGRNTDQLDESEITRATVETVAENTSDGVIAPLFYMFIGGAPLALAYKAVNTMDSMVGYKNEKYLYFGWASARFDDLANYIPARLTALLISLAAFFTGLNPVKSFRIMLRDRMNHSSPNSGYPEAAVAGAIGVQLGGINNYFGIQVHKLTLGDAERPMESNDIKSVIKLMYGSSVLAFTIFSIVIYIWEFFI